MTVTFDGTIHWREEKPGGLAVVDVPADLVGDLGGRCQMRVTGVRALRDDIDYAGRLESPFYQQIRQLHGLLVGDTEPAA
jgi:hypothetical protein